MKKEELLKAYSTMRTIRTFEERCDKEFMQGNIPGFVHLYAGQEAVAVGVCSHLSDEDKIGSENRKTHSKIKVTWYRGNTPQGKSQGISLCTFCGHPE